jgi:uroporphyrinogen III methyltransferase / synthase
MPEAVAVITHAARDDDPLARRLRDSGARVIELPCIAIEHLADSAELTRATDHLETDDWLVVTSPSGADAVARVSRSRARVAAIGEATASRLREHGIGVSFVPSAPTGAALGRELPLATRALLARSDRALPDLPRVLRERGFDVREVVAYHTRVGARGDVAAVRDALLSGQVEIYVQSPSALEGLRAAIEPELLARGVITHVAHR